MTDDDSLCLRSIGSEDIGALGSGDVVYAPGTELGYDETKSLSREVGTDPEIIVSASISQASGSEERADSHMSGESHEASPGRDVRVVEFEKKYRFPPGWGSIPVHSLRCGRYFCYTGGSERSLLAKDSYYGGVKASPSSIGTSVALHMSM